MSTTEGNGGERISYTTKELLQEIKGMVTVLGAKLDQTTAASAEEVRTVRHRVNNIETQLQLQKVVTDHIKDLQAEVEDLKQARAEQKGAGAFQKIVIGLIGVAVINLLFNLIQQLSIGGQ